jgi:hypothetical protein
MPRKPILSTFVVLAVSGLVAATTLAGGAPPPDATPGASGVTGAVLGSIDPVAASGYRLVLSESVWAPDAYVTSHTHPIAEVFCVQTGALGFTIQEGAATLTRGGTGEAPEATEPLELNTEVVLEPRDCVAFDEFASHTVHTAWNASDGETVLWEADLLKLGEPYTTFVDEHGTPIP